MTFKPMLAGKAPEDLREIRYPVLASAKLDGIRCLIRGGQAVSRNLKPIPNRYVQECLKGLPEGLDGELMLVDNSGGFNAVQSAVMRADGEPNFLYEVFDFYPNPHGELLSCDGGLSFVGRRELLCEWFHRRGSLWAALLPHYVIENAEQLAAMEADVLERGYEGVMVRNPDGLYKYGRSTTREGGLLKVKQFTDEEAVVVALVERMHNDNEATKDAFGRTERSSHKENLRPAGDLGALVCRTPDGAVFQIGTGFTAAQRVEYWQPVENALAEPWRHQVIGSTVTFKHQPDPGGRQPGQAPRFPVFLGFRRDL
jgi:DNA ligase-1